MLDVANALDFAQGMPHVQPRDPINSIFITQLQRRIEVRFRSHRRLAWAVIGGRRVLSVEV